VNKLPRFVRYLSSDTWVGASPLKATISSDFFRGQLTVRADGPRWPDPPEDWKVAHESEGGVLNRIPRGEGAIYLLLDDYVWCNAGFDDGENALVLASILNREIHGGLLGFDENRHGHGAAESFVVFLHALPGAASFMWISAILGGAYFFGRNVRFGPPEPFNRPERRTAREYIDAVAHLYERARAAPLVVEAVSDRIRHLGNRRAGTDPIAQELLAEAEQFVADAERPANPDKARQFVSRLNQFRKNTYGS